MSDRYRPARADATRLGDRQSVSTAAALDPASPAVVPHDLHPALARADDAQHAPRLRREVHGAARRRLEADGGFGAGDDDRVVAEVDRREAMDERRDHDRERQSGDQRSRTRDAGDPLGETGGDEQQHPDGVEDARREQQRVGREAIREREEQACPDRRLVGRPRDGLGVRQVRAQIRVARDPPPRALVLEDRAADVAGLEVRVPEVEVEVPARQAGGDELLVLRRGLRVALLRVERVRAEEDRLRAVRRRRGAGRRGAHRDDDERRRGDRAPEPSLALERTHDRVGASERPLDVGLPVGRGREPRLLARREKAASSRATSEAIAWRRRRSATASAVTAPGGRSSFAAR
jgi:hypothetical protein